MNETITLIRKGASEVPSELNLAKPLSEEKRLDVECALWYCIKNGIPLPRNWQMMLFHMSDAIKAIKTIILSGFPLCSSVQRELFKYSEGQELILLYVQNWNLHGEAQEKAKKFGWI